MPFDQYGQWYELDEQTKNSFMERSKQAVQGNKIDYGQVNQRIQDNIARQPQPIPEKNGLERTFDLLKQTSGGINEIIFGTNPLDDLYKRKQMYGEEATKFSELGNPANLTTADKVARGTGNALGFLMPYSKAYQVSNKALQGTKLLNSMNKLGKGAKYGEDALKGGLSGLQVGLATEGRDALVGADNQTLGDRAKDVALETGLGFVGDPLIRGLGVLGKKGLQQSKPFISDTLSKLKSSNKTINESVKLSDPKSIESTKAFDEVAATSSIPEEKIILSQDKKPFNLKEKWDKFYENTIDSQKKFGQISKDTKIAASNARQTQGVLDYIAESGLVDKEGRKIGESLKELTQSIPLEKEKDFWRYVAHKHNVSRAKEGKNVFSQFDSEASNLESQNLLMNNPEFEVVGKKVTKWINDFMDNWAGDLVGKEKLDLWKAMYPDYIPVYREMDPLKSSNFGNNAKKGFVNQNNLVKKAKGAKEDLSSSIKDPTANITQLINKTVKAAKNNDVGLEILKSVREGGLDDIFEIVPSKQGLVDDVNQVLEKDGLEGVLEQFNDQFDDIFKQVEKGNNIVKVMENGNEVLLKVKDKDYLRALQSLGEGNGQSAAESFEKAARKVTRPIKELITGKNPLFAVFNALKDTPTAFIQGQEKNPIKFANRYFKALKGITHNTKEFQEFVAQGGMQSGFFKNDVTKTVNKLKNPKISAFEKVVRTVEAFNNLTEATPRYMEYLATLEKGGTKAEAIYNAAEVTVNFARSGKWGKFFDSFILYLNPALQGFDKFVRQVKDKPLQTALKSAGVITAPHVITSHMNKDNPNYQSLDQRTKDDFFLIPNKYGPTDKEGNPETFFRIPKARQYSLIFSVLIDRATQLAQGKGIKEASKGLAGAYNRNFSVPTRPVWQPFLDVKSNKDWKDAPINPLGMELDGRSNYLKYDETTSEIGKVLSKLLNESPIENIKYSPKEIDYLIDSFTGIIGDLVLPMATKKETALGVPKKKFITDSVYSNQEVTDFYENLQKARTQAADRNILENIPSKTKTAEEDYRNKLNKLSDQMSKLRKQSKQTDDVDEQRSIQKLIIDLARQGNRLYNQK